MPTLFDPLKIGDLEVPNRIFLAPLTRNRSTGPGRVPNAMMRDYYVQRASAGHETDGPRPLCGIYFNLHSPYRKTTKAS
jgi:hypothetical protein